MLSKINNPMDEFEAASRVDAVGDEVGKMRKRPSERIGVEA